MKNKFSIQIILTVLLYFIFSLPFGESWRGASLFAHGGEDHGEKKPEKVTGKSYFTVNSVSDVFEMVLRYQPIETGHGTAMTLFVSDFETNIPVDSAKIEITCPDDEKLKFIVEQTDKGIYKIGGTFPENKKYSLVVNISDGDNADLMTLEGIEVGKELAEVEEAHTEASFFSWQTIGTFLGGIIFTVLSLWLLMRKKRVTITH